MTQKDFDELRAKNKELENEIFKLRKINDLLMENLRKANELMKKMDMKFPEPRETSNYNFIGVCGCDKWEEKPCEKKI